MPSAHPQGPVALAVDLRDDSFAMAAFELTGRCTVLDRHERETGSGTGMLADVAARLNIRRRQFGDRVVGIGVAVPSPLSAGQMVQPTLPDWQDVDVAAVLGGSGDEGDETWSWPATTRRWPVWPRPAAASCGGSPSPCTCTSRPASAGCCWPEACR